jgi:hypothetical protein
MPSTDRRRSNSGGAKPIRATNMHAAAKRRTKQNSLNSLDDFWGGIDELEYSRGTAVVVPGVASPRIRKSERSHLKQLSSQTAKTATVDESVEFLPPSLRQIEFVGEKAMTKVEERNATVAARSSTVAAKEKSDKRGFRLLGCIWKGKSTKP